MPTHERHPSRVVLSQKGHHVRRGIRRLGSPSAVHRRAVTAHAMPPPLPLFDI